jgi:hypothetical protein
MFRRIGDLLTVMKALKRWGQIRDEVNEMGTGKSIFISKTFWFNLLSIVVTIGGVLPDRWAVPAVAVANIGLRIISGEPVRLWKE